ncbi:hypothetical protein [Peptoanaerobacter stomatis]
MESRSLKNLINILRVYTTYRKNLQENTISYSRSVANLIGLKQT